MTLLIFSFPISPLIKWFRYLCVKTSLLIIFYVKPLTYFFFSSGFCLTFYLFCIKILSWGIERANRDHFAWHVFATVNTLLKIKMTFLCHSKLLFYKRKLFNLTVENVWKLWKWRINENKFLVFCFIHFFFMTSWPLRKNFTLKKNYCFSLIRSFMRSFVRFSIILNVKINFFSKPEVVKIFY